MKRVIYVLKNSADPSVVKVGMSDNLHRRIGQMNSLSSTVGEWSDLKSFEIPDLMSLEEAEQVALTSLNEYKVPGRREQFRIEYSIAISGVARALRIFFYDQVKQILEEEFEPGSIEPDSDMGRAGAKFLNFIFNRLTNEQGIIPELGEEGTDEFRNKVQLLNELSKIEDQGVDYG